MAGIKYPCITFQWLNQQKAEPVIFIHLDKSRYTALSTAPNISDEQIFITPKVRPERHKSSGKRLAALASYKQKFGYYLRQIVKTGQLGQVSG